LPTISRNAALFVTSATESTGKEELLSYIDEVNQEVLE
jgi:GTP-binding protein